MFSDHTLEGKTVLITGGGSGLGLAIAEACLRFGAKVGICGRSRERLEKAKDKLSTSEFSIAIAQADVRVPEEVERAFSEIEEEIGNINCLVNNAAGNFYSASEDLTANGFRSIVETVLFGSFHCTQTLGKRLIASGSPGTVLSIVTTYVQTGSAFVLPSACAKAGVQALTGSLAYEWADGIRLNSIAPGPFPTAGAWDRLIPGENFEAQYRERHPLKRFGKPEELSNLAVFLLSDLSQYINGECIAIDGGERLQGAQFNFLANLMPRKDLKSLFKNIKSAR